MTKDNISLELCIMVRLHFIRDFIKILNNEIRVMEHEQCTMFAA